MYICSVITTSDYDHIQAGDKPANPIQYPLKAGFVVLQLLINDNVHFPSPGIAYRPRKLFLSLADQRNPVPVIINHCLSGTDMKTAYLIIVMLSVFVAFSSCSKNDGSSLTKEEQAALVLSGGGNKVWHLKEVKVNNVTQALTASQAKYTKTYTLPSPNTVQGNFTDSDNYFGDWNMKGAAALQEIFQQIGGTGYGYRDYTIVTLTANTLDVYYVQNNAKVEEVYYAY